MKHYTVVLNDAAEGGLAEAYLAAADRNAVTTAGAEIERTLARDPTGAGQEKHEGLRELQCDPLRVFFSVSPADRVVEVAMVRLLPGRARADRHPGNGRTGD